MVFKRRTIELFSGTKSFSKAVSRYGFSTLTLDNDPSSDPDLCIDFMDLPLDLFLNRRFDICWISPPCDCFSIASFGCHWKRGYKPKTDKCKRSLIMLRRIILWVLVNNPEIWYIENPRGMMRKVIDDIFSDFHMGDYRRITITYCSYGDKRMKPTDIWTNDFNWKPKDMCKNGDSCHDRSPRGSRTGTQGLRGSKERSKIPRSLFRELYGSWKK